MWPGERITSLFGTVLPIVQAPMAGAQDAALTIAVCQAGGLGSLPCAMLTPDQARSETARIREATESPFSMNFFCTPAAHASAEVMERWQTRLLPYFDELGVEEPPGSPATSPAGFGEAECRVVEDLRPAVVSFHFGLPEASLLARVRATGARVISSANTVTEARWLEAHGVDAIIAQGAEAGGHQAMFLRDDVSDISRQIGTFALVPLVVDAVSVPVIAAGGISDGRGIAAAFALGASGVQIGSAYLFTPEATIAPWHRAALEDSSARGESETALTNVFSGRPARSVVNRLVREVGPISSDTPPFPLAGRSLAPLRAAGADAAAEFSSLWSGQAAPLGRPLPATELTRGLWDQATEVVRAFGAAETWSTEEGPS